MSDTINIPEDTVLNIQFLINKKESNIGQFLKSADIKFEFNKIPTASFTFTTENPNISTEEIENILELKTSDTIELRIWENNAYTSLFKGFVKEGKGTIANSGCSEMQLECKDLSFKLTKEILPENNEDDFKTRLNNIIKGDLINKIEIEENSGKEFITQTSNTTNWDYLLSYLDAIGQIIVLRNQTFSTIDINSENIKKEAEKILAVNGVNVYDFSGTQDKNIVFTSATIEVNRTGVPKPEIIKSNINVNNSAKNSAPKITLGESKLSTTTLTLMANTIVSKTVNAETYGNVKTIGNTQAKLGDLIKFDKVNPKIDANKYLISVEKHSIENGCWKTEYNFGLENTQSFAQNIASTSQSTTSEVKVGQSNSMQGLQIGYVTQLAGDPEGLFRVKVKIPAISDNSEGVWARLSSFQAGKERGSFFIPEVEDEVILGFLNKSADNPVILGKLFSSEKPMPYPITGKNTIQAIVSKEGIKIELDDDKKAISLSTPNGNKLNISDDEKGFVLEDENGNKITMNKDGISLESVKDITLKANSNISTEALLSKHKAKGNLELSGTLIKLN